MVAELLEKVERSLNAHLNEDWLTFLDSCASFSRSTRNIENLKGEYARLSRGFDREDIFLTGFEAVPLNSREFLVKFDVFFSGEYAGSDALFWTVENGQWVNKECLLGHE